MGIWWGPKLFLSKMWWTTVLLYLQMIIIRCNPTGISPTHSHKHPKSIHGLLRPLDDASEYPILLLYCLAPTMGKQEHLVEHKSKHGCSAVSKVHDEYWENLHCRKKFLTGIYMSTGWKPWKASTGFYGRWSMLQKEQAPFVFFCANPGEHARLVEHSGNHGCWAVFS